MRMKIIFKKLTKFAQIMGILNKTFKPTLVQKISKIKLHNTMVLLLLVYGNEIWTLIKKWGIKYLTSIEKKFSRRKTG
jgi:hypothetical protein